MTRPIVDWFSELVFFKSQIGPGRKNSLPYGSRSSHSCSTRRTLRIEDRMLLARHGFEPTSSTMTCPASPPFLFYFASTH